MKINKRKRRLIIQLAESELHKNHSDKALNKSLRSIITKMNESLLDAEANKGTD